MKITSIEQLKNAPSGWCIYEDELFFYCDEKIGLRLQSLKTGVHKFFMDFTGANIETVRIKKYGRVYVWGKHDRPEYPRIRYYKECSNGHWAYTESFNIDNNTTTTIIKWDNVEPLSIEDVEPIPKQLPTDEEIFSHVWRDDFVEKYILFTCKIDDDVFSTSEDVNSFNALRQWFKNRKKIRITDED